MDNQITQKSIRQFTTTVSHQHHAMAGAVIATSAAQAAALGRACLQISLTRRVDVLDTATVTPLITELDRITNQLLDWSDRDATAIAEFVALREAGQELQGQQLLCQAPAEVSRLALAAATHLQAFRPQVDERVRDDLEMSITLLAGAAQAAMLLLDSNLRIWPEPALLAEYEPLRAELEARIGRLSPVTRIRA